jgi:hypothetical protein
MSTILIIILVLLLLGGGGWDILAGADSPITRGAWLPMPVTCSCEITHANANPGQRKGSFHLTSERYKQHLTPPSKSDLLAQPRVKELMRYAWARNGDSGNVCAARVWAEA